MGLLIETLADYFYEASILPEFWRSVLLSLSTTVSSVGAVVLVADVTNAGRWVA